MNMDTNKKHTSLRAIILAACSLLLLGACDNYACDDTEPDAPAKEVSLNFNASIERTNDAQSRAITTPPITDFDEDSYSFGMSITKNQNGNEIFKGSSDMTATMTRSAAQWTWSFTDNFNASIVTPIGPEGKALKVVAYYPPVSSDIKDVYTNGIPFDFSSKIDLQQTDLLYNTDTAYTVVASSTEPVATIPLNFRHAYTWIVINITKYVDKEGETSNLSSVSLDNLGGSWIKNRGAIDPKTGLAKDGATAGPIGVTFSPKPLSKTEVQTYEFLVPSFMDTKVGNGDIVLVLNVNNINETFNLDKGYLNQSDDGTSFGFRQGYKNTYNLVYNNSALSMSIQDWSSEVINGEFGGDIPSSEVEFRKLIFQNPYWPVGLPKPIFLTDSDHIIYADYLTTVAYGGNGDYVAANAPTSSPTDMQITDDVNVYTKEKAYPSIQITQNDVSIAPIPWEDENGELVAKELCRKYNGGGFNNWRLPRATELRAVLIIVASNGGFSDLTFNSDANRDKPYWTGTEVDENQAWSLSYKQGNVTKNTKLVLSPLDKKMTASVRCVRDAS